MLRGGADGVDPNMLSCPAAQYHSDPIPSWAVVDTEPPSSRSQAKMKAVTSLLRIALRRRRAP